MRTSLRGRTLSNMNIILFALFLAAATPTDFVQAVRDQDVAKVQSMLEADPSLANAHTEKGRSVTLLAMMILVNKESFMLPANNPVLQAILARHPKLDVWETAVLGTPTQLSAMLKPGEVNAMTDYGWTLLHLAAFGGNAPNVKLLLDRGADLRIRAKTKFRNTPFMVAMLTRDAGTVTLLLDRGADILDRQAEGDTALHEAAATGDFPMTKLLVERGSDLNARDDEGKSALDYAIERKHDEIAEFLRSKSGK
jgi:hypothetical protein